MSISCSCGDGSGDYAYMYMLPNPLDFKPLVHYRACRCTACKKLVKVGDDCITFERMRTAKNRIEERIYGEGYDVPLADGVLCEECGGLVMALQEVNLCYSIDEPLKQQVLDWAKNKEHYYQ